MSAPKRNATSGPSQVPTDKVEQLVELLVAEVLQTRSMSLTRTDDGISEPAALRRADGSSVYTVAGSELFTSDPDPGRRAATRRDRGPHRRTRRRTPARWSWRCWNQPRTGSPWMPDRPRLVRAMCTSGARLQLAIAPAGAGKTTAMRTLTQAWTRQRRPGGRAGPVRRRGRAAPRRRPAHRPTRWPSSPGPSTTTTCPTGRNASAGPRLVIIDEAGMADTLSLDTAVAVHHRPRRQRPAGR